MKNWIMRIPDAGPLGLTFLLAMTRAMVLASFVNSPAGGNVETVFTSRTHRFLFVFRSDMRASRTNPVRNNTAVRVPEGGRVRYSPDRIRAAGSRFCLARRAGT